MPNYEVIDREFLLMYKGKIQKMFTQSNNHRIAVSFITRNHLYPKIGGKSTAADCMKFLHGMEINGIGNLKEENGTSFFVFVEKENASADQIELLKVLDIKI